MQRQDPLLKIEQVREETVNEEEVQAVLTKSDQRPTTSRREDTALITIERTVATLEKTQLP